MTESSRLRFASMLGVALFSIMIAACDTTAPGAQSGSPTAQPGSAPVATQLPSPPVASTPEGSPVPMQTYHDDQYGFAISYPADYVLMPSKTPPQQQPQPIHKVQFLSKMLAQSNTAALQPPELAIEDYDNPNQQPLENWLQANGLLPSSFTSQPYSLAGASGLQVSNPQQLAPNQFYYLAHGGQIYRLIPLGAIGIQMMGSFMFTR